MKPLISVIIPAFGIAEELPGIVGDLLGQPFQFFEILIVLEDGDDDTISLARDLAQSDKRIKTLMRSGKGVSAARNAGIEAASGEYIVFSDGDDRVSRGYLGTLIATIATPSKEVKSKGFARIPVELGISGYDISDNGEVIGETCESGIRVIDQEDFLCRLFLMENYQGYVWNKIFKKSIIDRYGLRFDEDCYYREDQLFVLEYALHCSSIRYNPARTYHYQVRKGSATDQLSGDDGVIGLDVLERQMTMCLAFSRMRKLLKKHEDPQWFLEQVYVFYALECFYRMRLVEDRGYFRDSYFRRIAREVCSIDYYPLDEWEEEQLMAMKEYEKTGILKENNEVQ